MSRDETIALIEALHALWNSGDVASIPKIYASDFIAHMPKGWERSEFHGHDGVRELICRIRDAFSRWTEHVDDIIIDGNKVVTRYTSTGVHTGPFIGLAPTGRSVRIDEISIYRIKDGLVAEQWCLTDDLTMGRQLGRIA